MIDVETLQIAAAIERGITGQANFIAGLATAIFGGIVVLRLQYRLSGGQAVRWTGAFWGATVFVVPTIALAFSISGLLVELAPILFSFHFDLEKEFSSQDFCGTRIGQLEIYSLIQLITFVLFVALAGAFALKNVVANSR